MSRISPTALTKEQLVDRWGAARAKAKKLEAEIEPLKEEFERRGLSVVAGEAWGVASSLSDWSSPSDRGEWFGGLRVCWALGRAQKTLEGPDIDVA